MITRLQLEKQLIKSCRLTARANDEREKLGRMLETYFGDGVGDFIADNDIEVDYIKYGLGVSSLEDIIEQLIAWDWPHPIPD